MALLDRDDDDQKPFIPANPEIPPSAIPTTNNLTLEQQFSVRTFEAQVNRMSPEQARKFLIELYSQMLIRENFYKQFLKHSWGLETGVVQETDPQPPSL